MFFPGFQRLTIWLNQSVPTQTRDSAGVSFTLPIQKSINLTPADQKSER
jgi:hypothetical protein